MTTMARKIGDKVRVRNTGFTPDGAHGGKELDGEIVGKRIGWPGSYPIRFKDGSERAVTHSDFRVVR